jgi:hypothetical protein
MDTLATKIFNFHTVITDIIKKLLKKNDACKARVLLWLRKVVSLNMDKSKYHSMTPLASDGFVLNLIDTLL